MIEIPFFAYFASDINSLYAYEHHKTVPVADVQRRLLACARKVNPYLPDYVYNNRYQGEEPDIAPANMAELIIKGLANLAQRYMEKVNGHLYVKRERFEEWMEVVKLFPPLLINAAFYLPEYLRCESKKEFFYKVLVPQFDASAQRLPYIFELDNAIKNGELLNDLHIHLNGTTETDVLWWSQIGNVEQWAKSIREGLRMSRVKTQSEQLDIPDTELILKWLYTAKKLLQKLAGTIAADDPVFDNAWQFYKPYAHLPVLAKGAYLYIRILEKLQKGNVSMAADFHHYILILGRIHMLLVQQRDQKGFTQFGVIPHNNLRRLHESTEYLKRFKQLMRDDDIVFLKHLEGRFSPFDNVGQNRLLIKHIQKQFREIGYRISEKNTHIPSLSLIAHFIKRPDPDIFKDNERHHRLRIEVQRKALALLKTAKLLDPDDDANIVGIDAASNEMNAGPEVFSPSFRFMRNNWTGKKNLHITFHAGEDFIHLLSGLRMIMEAVIFLDMRQGDRIGHGTAAGIEPGLWMDRIGEYINIGKGEWLDNLVWVYWLISDNKNPYTSLKSLLPTIKDEIEERVMYIYQETVSINQIIKAWLCRKFSPQIYLYDDHNFLADTCEEQKYMKQLLEDNTVRKLYENYHFNREVKRRYCQMEQIDIANGLFSSEDFRKIQNLVLHGLALKNIALEVPISSNLSISFYRELSEHHLDRWLKGHSENELLVPPVVIGSDDPGIFMTNIYIEYARIMEYLQQKGYTLTERIQKITELRQLSDYYMF